MININDTFLFQMLEEVGLAFQHGVNIKTPVTYAKPSQGRPDTELELPKSLEDFFGQTSKLHVLWEVQNTPENTQPFREDPYLSDHYFSLDYDWGVVHEMLSGAINTSSSKEMFSPGFCRAQGYYYSLSQQNENPEEFFPFDICWSLTAVLRKTGNAVEDNVWLVNSDAHSLHNMKINIEQYLHLAYLAKGFHHWQLAYLFREQAESHGLLQNILPKILPHVQLDLKEFGI